MQVLMLSQKLLQIISAPVQEQYIRKNMRPYHLLFSMQLICLLLS